MSGGSGPIGYSSSHIEALAFIEAFAAQLKLPVVVNVNQGMNAGAHDGKSSLEVAFDAFSDSGRSRKGRVVVIVCHLPEVRLELLDVFEGIARQRPTRRLACENLCNSLVSKVASMWQTEILRLQCPLASSPSSSDPEASCRSRQPPRIHRRDVAGLALHPNPKVSAPILKGLVKSLAQHEKLVASEEYKKLTPREKLQALRDIKSEEHTEANAEHQARCAKTRDEIVARSRAPFTKK